MKTIDITPKWSGITPLLLEILKHPKANPKSKQFAEDEIIRMAKIADSANMVISESKEKLEQYCKEQLDTENKYTIINNDNYEEGHHYKSQGGKHNDGYLISKLMKI